MNEAQRRYGTRPAVLVNPNVGLTPGVGGANNSAMVTVSTLDSYLGKHIRDICGNSYVNDSDNHCAHFVSHVLGLKFGATCHMLGKGKVTGANVRVQEVFGRCAKVGTWDTSSLTPGEYVVRGFVEDFAGNRTSRDLRVVITP